MLGRVSQGGMKTGCCQRCCFGASSSPVQTTSWFLIPTKGCSTAMPFCVDPDNRLASGAEFQANHPLHGIYSLSATDFSVSKQKAPAEAGAFSANLSSRVYASATIGTASTAAGATPVTGPCVCGCAGTCAPRVSL